MTYSLVNMPVLGYDLCRMDRGTEVADVLLAALTATPDGLARAAGSHAGSSRHRAWSQAVGWADAQSRTVDRLRLLSASASASASASGTALALQTLEQSRLGDVHALVRLVREDIFDTDTRQAAGLAGHTAAAAVEVISDAAAAGYLAGEMPAALRSELLAPWGGSRQQVAAYIDLGPNTAAVHRVLADVRALSAAEAYDLRSTVDASRPTLGAWSTAVHGASWAVYLTGRLRAAAAAQLLLVRAFGAAGFTAQDGARGVWNTLSGLVQSTVVEDVLDSEAAEILHENWLAARASRRS